MVQFEDSGVRVFQSVLYQTTSTVIDTEDFVLIVDPNWLPDEIKQIQEYVTKIKKGKQLLLLFTHSDYDHIIGYKAFPDAKIIASKALVDNSDKKSILQQIRKFDDEYYIERDYPIAYPEVDIIVSEDFQELVFDHSQLNFWLAPGHNVDGIFTLVKPLNILIVGDYLSDVEFPYIYFSSEEYKSSIDKAAQIIRENDIRLLIPGHGRVTSQLDEMKKRIKDSKTYINSLRACVQKEIDFPFQELMKQYKFPGIMKKFHDGNVQLIRKELQA